MEGDSNSPQFSVIIPAFNQAEYLVEAIESVLAQTFTDYEVIVVDDGSTDDTPDVVGSFEGRIRYVRQTNKGLGGARNTGIQIAKGYFIALLDSDDQWYPDYLLTMLQVILDNPQAAVYYCGARYMDSRGFDLPQAPIVKLVHPDLMYEELASADFLLPSAIIIRRSAVIEAGLFDPAFRRCEDWDLWLRMATVYKFVGIQKILVRYRLHESSLSTDPSGMQQAVKAVVEKHFGLDDGQWLDWSRRKRKAYGGVYRYNAWTSILRKKDWQAGTDDVRRALQIDPLTSIDIDFFYSLALGHQPLGYRGTPYHIELQANIEHLIHLLENVFDPSLDSDTGSIRRQTFGTAYFALGLVAYNTGQLSLSRDLLVTALRFRPGLWRDRRVPGNLVKSFLGLRFLNSLRQLRKGVRLGFIR